MTAIFRFLPRRDSRGCLREVVLAASLLIILFTASAAQAQSMPPPPRREGFSVGILLTTQLGVGNTISARVGVPAGNHAGFDFDLGYRIGRKPAQQRAPHASGWVTGAHVRWLPRGRRDTGWGTALSFGLRLMEARGAGHARFLMFGVDLLTLGVDRVLADGHRVGIEGGSSVLGSWSVDFASEGLGVFISGFGLWKPK